MNDVYVEVLVKVCGNFDSFDILFKVVGVKKMIKVQLKELMVNVGIKDLDVQFMKDEKGNVMVDLDLCENENVLLGQDIYEYFVKEVLLYVVDVWIDEVKRDEKDGEVGIVGYEINFNCYFYEY